jgi:hypothetical protein
VRAWDPATRTLNHTLHGLSPFLSALVEVQQQQTDAHVAHTSAQGTLLAVGSADGSIALCDILAGRVVSTLQVPHSHSPHSKRLRSAGRGEGNFS